MIDHFRLVSLMFILWIIDVVVLTYALDAVMQDGISIVVLFVNEVCDIMTSPDWTIIYAFSSVCHSLRGSYSLRTEVLPPCL